MSETPSTEHKSTLEQVQHIRTRTLELIAELVQQPKPSYTIDGQSVSWNEYLKQLQNTILWCDEMTNGAVPPIVVSHGRSS